MNFDRCLDSIFFINDKYNLSKVISYNKKKRIKYKNIYNYILNRFCDSASERETLYRIHYHIENKPVCPVCGKPLKFYGRDNKLFLSHCSNKCKKLDNEVNEKWKNSCGDLGTNREKYKQTILNKYGVENPYQIPDIIEKIRKINKEKIHESLKKQEQTNLLKYGVKSYLQTDEIKEKRKHTSLLKYGVDHPMKSDIVKQKYNWHNIVNKINETKNKNNTFNTSNTEEISYELLKLQFPDVIRQYRSDVYPFNCDFFIPSLDLYIECNYHWSHGKHPFNKHNKNDIERLDIMHKKHSKYYDISINVWTIKDPLKRQTAKENKLNWIEFFDFNIFKFWLNHNDLHIELNENAIRTEYEHYLKTNGKISKYYKNSYIVKYFQQDIFYKKEFELWDDLLTRKKLIDNRIQYLNKSIDDITNINFIDGFKRSMIYYGYSHFNPLWFKWFIQKYGCKSCYDPCGGWGHRLLGSDLLDQYIYNDLSETVHKNVNNMIDYLNIENCITYNNDANDFIPSEDFDSMFTCPPYYNLEHYECGDFESLDAYNQFIDNLFNCFYTKSTCRIFGLVIREDLLADKWKDKAVDSFLVNDRKPSHMIKEKCFNEYLYVFMK